VEVQRADTEQVSTTADRRWRWPQFSLRMLLIGILLVSPILAWLHGVVNSHSGEECALAALEQVDASVATDPSFPQWLNWIPWCESFESVTWIGFRDQHGLHQLERDLSEEYITRFHDLFPAIASFRHLEGIDLSWSLVSDHDVDWLTDLKYLREVDLSHTKITDAGVVKLEKLQLQTLSLSSTAVTDACIRKLPLRSLRTLELADCGLSEVGVRELSSAKRIETLHIGGGRITNRCLEYLRKLKSLRRLEIETSRITPSGVADFHKALPHVDLEFQGDLQIVEFQGRAACNVYGAMIVVDSPPPPSPQSVPLCFSGASESGSGIQQGDFSLTLRYRGGVVSADLCGERFEIDEFGTIIRYKGKTITLKPGAVVYVGADS
jgi:hypothetical protein